MPNPRDLLPQPPWDGPPIPEGIVKAMKPSPEQIGLIQQVNDEIRKRTTYGVREERVAKPSPWCLDWSNGSACWYISGKPAWYDRETLTGYKKATKVGDAMLLDANQIVVYAKKRDIGNILNWLEPLPLYAHSFESKRRGFGTSPPPLTKHWTWPELPTLPPKE